MNEIEIQRKRCLKQQTELRVIMTECENLEIIIKAFIKQHSILHSAAISNSKLWSFEDAIFNGASEEVLRRIPVKCKHSILWNIWHLARIEDVTMNILVAGNKQVLQRGNWNKKLKVNYVDTGNCMSDGEIKILSETINIAQLRAYRLAVGNRTQEIVSKLKKDDLTKPMEQNNLNRLMKEGALREEAVSIKEYWAKRDVAGLLLMPATRHNIVHLNEALQLKQRKK